MIGTDPSLQTMHAYGAVFARLHLHGAGHRPSDPSAPARYDRLNPFEEPFVLFEALPELLPPATVGLFDAARSRVEAGLAALRASGEPMRVVHGDLNVWNVMVSRSGLAPFDFEDLMWGWPIQDVATSLWYLMRMPGYPERRAAFRSGYETVLPWPERADGELMTCMMGRYLALGNDLLIAPEGRPLVTEYLGRYADGLRILLGG